MNRLSLISQQLNTSPTVQKQATPLFTDCWSFLRMQDYQSEKGKDLQEKIAKFNKEEMGDKMIPFVNSTDFPFHLIPKLKEIGVCGFDLKGYGSPSLGIFDAGAVFYEIAKEDLSLATFFVVHNCLGTSVVERLGDEEQKDRILPDCIALNKFICFGLTEPTHGSDATNLLTTARKTEGGFILNGQKRWIGNAGFADYIIVWAKNVDEGNKIQAFVVEKGSAGLSTSKIENKYSLRMVQNANIVLKDVFVPAKNRLAKAQDFATGANVILKHSRLFVAWFATGAAAGAIEQCHKYALERKQFGKSIAGFQIIQGKLVSMISQLQSMILLCKRVSDLYEKDQVTLGKIAMTKAYCTKTARDIIATAREIMGGNGILLENKVIKALIDIEGVHTYEGTYEINSLVAGREITGLNAFK